MSEFRRSIVRSTRLLLLLGMAAHLAACKGDSASDATANPVGVAQASGTNSPPILQGTPDRTATAGVQYAYAPIASDPDGDPLTFLITRQPAWATFDSETGRLSGTPQDTDAGEYPGVAISASDGQSESMVGPFTIVVVSAEDPGTPPAANSAPAISGTPPGSVVAGSSYGFTPAASDADGDPLTFSIANKPNWASFSASTGRLSGTPGDAAVGSYSGIEIAVSDGEATASLPPFAIFVQSNTSGGTPPPPTGNSAPTISGTAARVATVGTTYAFVPAATDSDGDALSFAIRNKPAWASFSTSSGRLSGTPSSSAVGSYTGIEISVSDGEATAALPAFAIEVREPPNAPPTISGSPARSVTAGTSYGFTPAASDADGDTLTFAIQNKPAWASFSTSNGRLAGTPATADVGTYGNIVINVSDGEAAASLAAFSIAVEQVSTGSVTLSWTPPTENTDGSALTNLAGYRIVYGTSRSNLDRRISLTNPGLTTAVVENLASGTWYFAVLAVNTAQAESDLSAIASKAIP